MDASLATIGLNVQRLMQNVRVLDQLQAADTDLENGNGDQATHNQSNTFHSNITSAAQDVAAAFLNLMETAMPANDQRGSDDVSLTW